MKFGLFTCGYQRTALEKAFADAKAFGYDYIELWGGRPHAYGPDLIRDDSRQLYRILELKERYEMPVPIYTPEHNAYPFKYMLGDEISRRESLEYLKCCIKAAGRVGADYMLVSAGHGGSATIELVTHYIDAPGEACGAALMYVRKLMKHYLPEGRQRRF